MPTTQQDTTPGSGARDSKPGHRPPTWRVIDGGKPSAISVPSRRSRAAEIFRPAPDGSDRAMVRSITVSALLISTAVSILILSALLDWLIPIFAK